MHGLMHGEKGDICLATLRLHTEFTLPAVAFGVVAQLILDGSDTTELDRYIALMSSVDLPVTFAQLGVPNVTDDELRAVAKAACAPGETTWNMERPVNEEIIFHAIKGANTASVDYFRRAGIKKA